MTLTWTVPVPGGVSKDSSVPSLDTVTLSDGTVVPSKLIDIPGRNPDPVILTGVPPAAGPWVGAITKAGTVTVVIAVDVVVLDSVVAVGVSVVCGAGAGGGAVVVDVSVDEVVSGSDDSVVDDVVGVFEGVESLVSDPVVGAAVAAVFD